MIVFFSLCRLAVFIDTEGGGGGAFVKQRNVWKEMTLEFPLLRMLALIILTPLFFDTVQVTPAACNAVLSPRWIFVFHV